MNYIEMATVLFVEYFGRGELYRNELEIKKILKTKIEEATKELQQKIQELEDARKKEADMLDIMGHELRTPATVVKLNAELLKLYEKFMADGDQTNYRKKVDRILESIDMEIKLINTLLSSAKLQGNQIILNKEPINIENSIDMSLHANEKKAKEKGLNIVWERKPDGSIPLVFADKVRLQEIIDNLIGNAVKFTQKGEITVFVEQIEGDFVKVSVKDTGPGIPEDQIKRLGEKFYRLDNYLREDKKSEGGLRVVRPGGTGLGLFVVFGLVDAHGGKVEVQSEVGVGSVFSFTIPIFKGELKDFLQKRTVNAFDKLSKDVIE